MAEGALDHKAKAERVLGVLGLTWDDVPGWQRAVLMQLLLDLPEPTQRQERVQGVVTACGPIQGHRVTYSVLDEVQALPAVPPVDPEWAARYGKVLQDEEDQRG